MNKKVLWITRTAIFTALLIVLQAATAPLGNTFLTGSLVNLVLILTVMLCGLSSGITIAIISPIFAKLVGIGPLWTLIPFIILGNIALVVVWWVVADRGKNKYVSRIVALVVGAVAKFVVLYLGVVKVAIPLIAKIPEPKASAISATFSLPQLITALIGGVVAFILIPLLQKAIKPLK